MLGGGEARPGGTGGADASTAAFMEGGLRAAAGDALVGGCSEPRWVVIWASACSIAVSRNAVRSSEALS